jgi:hypothetical protein
MIIEDLVANFGARAAFPSLLAEFNRPVNTGNVMSVIHNLISNVLALMVCLMIILRQSGLLKIASTRVACLSLYTNINTTIPRGTQLISSMFHVKHNPKYHV